MMDGINMKELLAKAGEIQKNIAKKKEEAAGKKVEVSVGGGMVQIVMNGNMETLSVKLDPEIVDRSEVDTLEDLIRAATNEAVREAKKLVSDDLTDVVSDLNFPMLNDLLKQ